MVSFKTLRFERTDGDCGAPAGCAVVSLAVPEIVKAPTAQAREALQRFIRHDWLAASFGVAESSDLAALAERVFAKRRSFLAESPGRTARWWVHRSVEVLYVDDHTVSLRYGGDSSTGGERPVNEVLLASFDPATGRRLTLADLCTGEEALRALAAERFRQVRRTAPGAPLPLEGHCAVVEAGLVCHFNPFELPGEDGEEESQIVLTRDELREILKPDGPLAVAARPRGDFPSPKNGPGMPGMEDEDQGWNATDVPR